MPTIKQIEALITKRSALVELLLNQLDKSVIDTQSELSRVVINDFVDKLDTDENGNIKNTQANRSRLALFDGIYRRFNQNTGIEVIKTIADGVGQMIDFNKGYFSLFEEETKLLPINKQVTETIETWLGVTDRGRIVENGYLDTLVKDSTVKNQIKNMMVTAIIGQQGYNAAKKQVKEYVEGNKEKTGGLERYYRNFVTDTYSVVDRTISKQYAEKLKLNYYIYEGGLVRESRAFCKKRNGQVFTSEEVSAFDPSKEGISLMPGYDPFLHLGSWGCRHHLNPINYTVAKALRPDLPKE
ncbi:MAG TPA: hypothetical protein VD794_16005 [Flavisolibacter sp.]|nr:hypothetical protein [Flavisolibacter sp.]